MDADGMVPNAGAFAQQTVSKELKNIGSSSIAKNNPMIQKGLEIAGKENANTEFNINKNIPGTQANRFQGVADDINAKIKNPKKKTVVQGTSSTRTNQVEEVKTDNWQDNYEPTEYESVDIIPAPKIKAPSYIMFIESIRGKK